MAWDVVSKQTGEFLKPSEVNQIGDNFTAIAAQDSGAPAFNVSSFIAQVASIAQLNISSGVVGYDVSCFGQIEIATTIPIAGVDSFQLTIEAQTSDYILSGEDVYGFKIITNEGAIGPTTFTLPGSGSVGQSAIISLVTSVAGGITIEAVNSDSIFRYETSGTTVNCIELNVANDQSTVELKQVALNKWFVIREYQNGV